MEQDSKPCADAAYLFDIESLVWYEVSLISQHVPCSCILCNKPFFSRLQTMPYLWLVMGTQPAVNQLMITPLTPLCLEEHSNQYDTLKLYHLSLDWC